MVNTRGQTQRPSEVHTASESTADQPGAEPSVRLPPPPRNTEGETGNIPRNDVDTMNATVIESALEARLKASMIQAMESAMSRQQEQFMKMLEDRDNGIRHKETTAENALNGPGPQENNAHAEKGKERRCSYKAFLGCRPPEFSGTTDPTKCMNWIREIEMSFEASECEESQKVKFASHLLRGEALTWWNLTRSSIAPTVLAKFPWTNFKKKILEKYCSERALDKIEDEFRGLKKGDMSVTEYSRLYLEKLNLVEYLAPDEKAKIKAYQRGLPANMKTALRNAKVLTIQGAIEEALRIEDDLVQEELERGKISEKRKREETFENSRRQKPYLENKSEDSGSEVRWCDRCRKSHAGPCMSSQYQNPLTCNKCGKTGHFMRDCPIKGFVCFECHEPGHAKRDCPRLRTGGSGRPKSDPPKATGRAFQMSANEARSSKDVE